MSDVWAKRYQHVCPSASGSILHIAGVGRKDTYNVAVYQHGTTEIIAFRAEQRRSFAWRPRSYHPMIQFASKRSDGWHVDPDLPSFDMMEDPFFIPIKDGKTKLIFGGVRVRRDGHKVIPQTELYRGASLETLEPSPFLVVDNMKEVRLLQLPDGRFLLCRRPWGDEYGRGRITLHVIDRLEDIGRKDLKTLALLDACQNPGDWVGANSAYLLKHKGEQWVGLLGHVAFDDDNGRHYAACTYKIRLKDLLDNTIHNICPHIITSRSCFAAAPAKRKTLQDVVFPGHLEHLKNNTYRLWAGLSDARIGTIELDDPFLLDK
jgi:hypothetical protein